MEIQLLVINPRLLAAMYMNTPPKNQKKIFCISSTNHTIRQTNDTFSVHQNISKRQLFISDIYWYLLCWLLHSRTYDQSIDIINPMHTNHDENTTFAPIADACGLEPSKIQVPVHASASYCSGITDSNQCFMCASLCSELAMVMSSSG